jgi:DNA-binding CsgD family transcriptional regulator
VRKLAAQALAGHQLLTSLAYPIWLIDTDRYIFHANPAAQAEQLEGRWAVPADSLLAQPGSGSRLRLRGKRSDAQLAQHLLSLQGGSHGDRAVIDARQRADDPPAWLHLQLVAPQQALGAFGDRPLVLATLFAPQIDQDLDAFALGDVFGLTPAQSRIAVLLAEGLTAAEIGSRIGCKVSTVRTHVRQVLAKLGASRSADAVRLLRQGDVLWRTSPTTQPTAQHSL